MPSLPVGLRAIPAQSAKYSVPIPREFRANTLILLVHKRATCRLWAKEPKLPVFSRETGNSARRQVRR